MPWATQRQLLFAVGVLAVVVIVLGGLAFLFLYEKPSCTDGVMNQMEEGIDCGGACAKLCAAPRVSALWARSVKVASGVYHAVALVKNPESSAGTMRLPYTFSLYNSENILIAERDGVMQLDPAEEVPLFEPNIVTGERVPVRTFVTFHEAHWEKKDRVASPVVVDSERLDQERLSLSARVTNVTAYPVEQIILTALLYDAEDILVAASRTVLVDIPARGHAEAVFTWQEPFVPPVVRTVITSRTH